jgi:hypothetical protein
VRMRVTRTRRGGYYFGRLARGAAGGGALSGRRGVVGGGGGGGGRGGGGGGGRARGRAQRPRHRREGRGRGGGGGRGGGAAGGEGPWGRATAVRGVAAAAGDSASRMPTAGDAWVGAGEAFSLFSLTPPSGLAALRAVGRGPFFAEGRNLSALWASSHVPRIRTPPMDAATTGVQSRVYAQWC